MSDLAQFFRQLVANLAATDPGRLHQRLELAEIQRDILPYRANRRVLGLESAEDYEVLLLRLCAGEEGLARTEPPEVQARFEGELAGSNPDLSLLRAHGDALVSLAAAAVARALAVDPHTPYAPRSAQAAMPEETLGSPFGHSEPELPSGDDHELPVDEAAGSPHPGDPHSSPATMCLYCGGTLPAGRQVNFCPHCGQSQRALRCPACQTEVEYGWRHCVTCGAPLGDG